jgi:MFS family permease
VIAPEGALRIASSIMGHSGPSGFFAGALVSAMVTSVWSGSWWAVFVAQRKKKKKKNVILKLCLALAAVASVFFFFLFLSGPCDAILTPFDIDSRAGTRRCRRGSCRDGAKWSVSVFLSPPPFFRFDLPAVRQHSHPFHTHTHTVFFFFFKIKN